MNGLVYGPQTSEIKEMVKALGSPENLMVLDAICDEYWVRDEDETEALQAIYFVMKGWAREAEVTGAEKAVRKATKKREGSPSHYPAWTLAMNISAVVLRDLIGGEFTQAHYDLLMRGLLDFMAIVNGSDPDSPLRELAVDLYSREGGQAAIDNARRTLVQ